MNVFGVRYQQIRAENIFPLLNYSAAEGKLEYNTIRDKIHLAKSASVLPKSHTYELIFDEEDIYKGLLGEIELFYTRSLVQYSNLKNSLSCNTRDWNYVTSYYFSFFSLNTCMRLNHRGTTYIRDDIAKSLTAYIEVLSGETVKVVPGNYVFSLRKDPASSNVILTLSNTSNGAHEQAWFSAYEFITEFLAKNKEKDDEYTILRQLLDIANAYKPTFASRLRNEINYAPQYGLISIKDELITIKPMDTLEKLVSEILGFQLKDGLGNEMKASIAYGFYFFILASKLYEEYRERGNACPLIEKTRRDFMQKNNIELISYPMSI